MVLYPEDQPGPSSQGFISAWEAVAKTQRAHAGKYRLVRQPDHARLSGELARHLATATTATMTEEMVSAISLHDEGWSEFDSGLEKLRATPAQYADGIAVDEEGKPLSFLDIKAGDFLHAWRGSIAAAEAVAPIAALMVSGHFYRLGKFGLKTGHYPPAEAALVQQFVKEEECRRERLPSSETRTQEEIEYWIDVLQFCDLLSLYLCCGSEESIEFPQRIASSGEAVRLRVEDGVNVLSPNLFAQQTELSLEAHVFPGGSPITLKWIVR